MKTPLCPPSSFIRRILPPLLVFLAAFALFAPSITYPLVDYDDIIFITRNALVRNGLSLQSVRDAFTTLNGDASMYSPLLWLSWMADVTFFGATPSNPWPFHFGNVFLHAINAVLLFFILRRCRAASLPAVLLALLWALHPLRVESVAWVTERKDTLSTLFAFASILFYLKAFPSFGGSGAEPLSLAKSPLLFLSLSFLALFLGLLVKPMLVTLPFLFLLFDIFPHRRIALDRFFSIRTAFRLLAEKTPFFLLAAVAALLSLLTQSKAILHSTSFLGRLALVPLHYAFYLIKTFIPIRLTPFYHPIIFSWDGFIPFSLLFAALFVSAWRLRATRPAWSLGILAFFGLFVPVVGFFHVGIHHFADRYSYLPAIGLSIAAIPILSSPSRPRRIVATTIASAALLALVPLTLSAMKTWSDQDVFYDRVEAIFPDHPYVVSYRARQLINKHGDFTTAEARIDESLATYPDHDSLRVLKAVCIDERLGPEAAFRYFASSTNTDYGYTPFELREIAQYAMRAGMTNTVPTVIDAIFPTLPKTDRLLEEALYLRLVFAFETGDGETLRRTAARIPKLAGHDPVTIVDLFYHYTSQWSHLHRRDAWDYFRKAAANPDNTPADLNNLAWVLSTAPGWNPAPPDEVLAIARRAADMAPGHPVILDTLAAAYANACDFSAAVETARKALSIAAPDPELSAKIQSHLDCYLQSRPFRSDI